MIDIKLRYYLQVQNKIQSQITKTDYKLIQGLLRRIIKYRKIH
jgi:hypothetical protein